MVKGKRLSGTNRMDVHSTFHHCQVMCSSECRLVEARGSSFLSAWGSGKARGPEEVNAPMICPLKDTGQWPEWPGLAFLEGGGRREDAGSFCRTGDWPWEIPSIFDLFSETWMSITSISLISLRSTTIPPTRICKTFSDCFLYPPWWLFSGSLFMNYRSSW